MSFRRPRSIHRFMYLGFVITLSMFLLHSNSSYDSAKSYIQFPVSKFWPNNSKVCNGNWKNFEFLKNIYYNVILFNQHIQNICIEASVIVQSNPEEMEMEKLHKSCQLSSF